MGNALVIMVSGAPRLIRSSLPDTEGDPRVPTPLNPAPALTMIDELIRKDSRVRLSFRSGYFEHAVPIWNRGSLREAIA